MDANDVAINVHEHCKFFDKQKRRFQCKYCDKLVSGSSRLKQHLGGIRGNVASCEKVPLNVKDLFSAELPEKRKESRKIGDWHLSDIPRKRNQGSRSGDSNEAKMDVKQPAAAAILKRVRVNSTLGKSMVEVGSCSKRSLFSQAAISGIDELDAIQKLVRVNSTPGTSTVGVGSCSKRSLFSQGDTSALEELASKQAQKCIGRFFCETGIDFSVAQSPSFRRMLNALIGCNQVGLRIPCCQDFKGWILEDEVKEMQEHVKEIRNSWVSTGCSILLDGWVDEKGRNLLHILVDCPRGPIYLRSLDISSHIGNVDALILVLDEVIEEVGADNVIQVMTDSASAFMTEVGKQLEVRHGKLFWTVSASHCFGLMLEKLGSMNLVRDVMEKAKAIVKFIYNRASVLELMKIHTDGRDLVSRSRIRSAMPFLTLENIVSERENLKEMFACSEISASSSEGRRIADLVADGKFWTNAIVTVTACIPVVSALRLINESNEPQLGFIYETMDQVKETIRKEFQNIKVPYSDFWKAIDNIWDNNLHNSLHSAGYYLNPRFFYARDFFGDAEVVGGLFHCFRKLTSTMEHLDVVSAQISDYGHGRGSFDLGKTPDRRTGISPALWWSYYGGGCPDLQRIAFRILSLTCDGASKYGLQRGLAESLLTKGRNPIEQQRLNDLAFVHYNLQLRNFAAGEHHVNLAEEIDFMDDWVMKEIPRIAPLNSEPRMELGGERSSAHPDGENM